jgi:nicotinamidase-related amidase
MSMRESPVVPAETALLVVDMQNDECRPEAVDAAKRIDYVLRNLGIRFLVVVGVVTDQCVESAIRDAADRGYLVTQVEDACAAYSSRTHDDSIQSMDGHYCRRRSTLEVIEEIAPG